MLFLFLLKPYKTTTLGVFLTNNKGDKNNGQLHAERFCAVLITLQSLSPKTQGGYRCCY